ncbi:unnamed protein product [Blepharisma stoltei]|uniref:Uncharacterized protein n=1 Tax=Blepharisma stoltei TaxID=1481888 RepID=A0AAU9K6P8_9CILI|nr:unnamed protein product [Blepharisma stoltei]
MSFFPGIVLWKAFLESNNEQQIKTARYQIVSVSSLLLEEKSIQPMTRRLLKEMKTLAEKKDEEFSSEHLKRLISFVDVLYDFCSAKIISSAEEVNTESDD